MTAALLRDKQKESCSAIRRQSRGNKSNTQEPHTHTHTHTQEQDHSLYALDRKESPYSLRSYLLTP